MLNNFRAFIELPMSSEKKMRAVAWMVFICGLTYLVITLVRQPLSLSDFRYIWTAGDVWARHRNPYSADFPNAGRELFPIGPYPIGDWVYPFHWFIPAYLISRLPPSVAFVGWLLLGVGLTAIAARLAFQMAKRLEVHWSFAASLFAAGYICGSTPLIFLLRHGQPAGLALFGVAVLSFGLAADRKYVMAIGASLAMLKPHLGIPIVAALMFMPRGLFPVIVGGLATALASLPAFVMSGLEPQIAGLWTATTSGYQHTPYNSAALMSGTPHLISQVTGKNLSIGLSTAFATIFAVAAVLLTRRLDLRDRKIVYIALSCAMTAAVVSLHGYDLVLLFVPLPLILALGRSQLMVAGCGYLLLWRAENLAQILGNFWYTPTIQTVAAFLILFAWLSAARRWSVERRQAGLI